MKTVHQRKSDSFSYKLWVLASSTGLPYHVDMYKGKSPNAKGVPLGERVVKTALKICDNPVTFSQVISCSLTWMLKDSEPLVL